MVAGTSSISRLGNLLSADRLTRRPARARFGDCNSSVSGFLREVRCNLRPRLRRLHRLYQFPSRSSIRRAMLITWRMQTDIADQLLLSGRSNSITSGLFHPRLQFRSGLPPFPIASMRQSLNRSNSIPRSDMAPDSAPEISTRSSLPGVPLLSASRTVALPTWFGVATSAYDLHALRLPSRARGCRLRYSHPGFQLGVFKSRKTRIHCLTDSVDALGKESFVCR